MYPSNVTKIYGLFCSKDQIGNGNFSDVKKCTHRITKEVFAMKVITKAKVMEMFLYGNLFRISRYQTLQIRRLKIRHSNIGNEILMEKKILSRLRHPGIVRVYHTFQVSIPKIILFVFADELHFT